MKLKIKICGITNLIDAKNALQLGADYIGFVNIKNSPRFITGQEIEEIFVELTDEERLKAVILTELDTIDGIMDLCTSIGIKFVQPYGSFSNSELDRLKLMNYRILKPLHVEVEEDIETIDTYQTSVEVVILDTKSSNPEVLGGTGETFDWDIYIKAQANCQVKLALAGGLDLDNIGEAISRCKPYMIDISSGLESCPGIKSFNKMKALFELTSLARLES